MKSVLIDDSEGVRQITLNRPDKLNSFNADLCHRLKEALDGAAVPGIRAVLITGAGRGFSAGQDLSERLVPPGGEAVDLGHTIETAWNPIARAIAALDKPVIAAVNGVAAGAGCNVALACDIVVAARSAKFIEPFCRLGLVPDAGGTFHLPRLVGLARAKGMAMLGEPVAAEDAERWGLIWKVFEDDKLMPEALKMARHLARQPTFGLGLMKKAFAAAMTNSFDAQLDLERDYQRRAGRTKDFAEGVAAFLKKRAPKFSGREE